MVQPKNQASTFCFNKAAFVVANRKKMASPYMSHEAGLVQLNEAFGEKNRPSSGPIKAKQRFIKTESSWWFQPI